MTHHRVYTSWGTKRIMRICSLPFGCSNNGKFQAANKEIWMGANWIARLVHRHRTKWFSLLNSSWHFKCTNIETITVRMFFFFFPFKRGSIKSEWVNERAREREYVADIISIMLRVGCRLLVWWWGWNHVRTRRSSGAGASLGSNPIPVYDHDLVPYPGPITKKKKKKNRRKSYDKVY